MTPPQVFFDVMTLKQKGREWWGLCPLHGEKSPSFHVNEKGLWHCFGCGSGGTTSTFAKRMGIGGYTERPRPVPVFVEHPEAEDIRAKAIALYKRSIALCARFEAGEDVEESLARVEFQINSLQAHMSSLFWREDENGDQMPRYYERLHKNGLTQVSDLQWARRFE